jgi:transposase
MARTILKNKEWEIIKPFIPNNKGKKGRPPKKDRNTLEAILWVLRTGAPWRDVPQELCHWKKAYMRFRRWINNGVWVKIWEALKKILITNHTSLTQQLSKSISTRVEQLENRHLGKQ